MAWQHIHGTLQGKNGVQKMPVVLTLSPGLSNLEVVGTKTKINLGRQREGGLSQRIRLISDDTMLGLNWGIK